MKQALFILLLIGTIFSFEIKNENDKETYKLLFIGLDQAHNGDYEKSLATYQKLIDVMPDHPAGYFYYSAALQNMMTDYRNFEYGKKFLNVMKKGISVSEKMVSENKSDPWAYFYRGAMYGYRGIYSADLVDGFKPCQMDCREKGTSTKPTS